MLSAGDLLLIVVTTVVCTSAVTVIAWLALRRNRRGSIASQTVIVVAAAVASIALTTIAVLVEMYFSAHDVIVLVWVMGVSGFMSLLAAWLLITRQVRASVTSVSSSARRLGDGAVVEAVPTSWKEFEEISGELAETSRKLAAAREEIESLDASRRQYVAWISHDLRTPLAGLQAMAEALEAGIGEDPTRYVRGIRGRVDTLNAMVEDLFELSLIQSGTLRLRRETVELLDLVSDAVADVMPVAESRGITIVPRGVEGRVLHADPRELTRALANLLSNGVRHSPDGGEIIVSADLLDGDRLVLSVLDQGPGVSSEELAHIFEVGWRADAARPARELGDGSTGAGLGLAIVRGIAEAHGGAVGAERVPEGFRLDLILPA
ncbi:sensor histidine kinase KdpD [Brachybacterium sp. FME24]|uniref:sensor histidine kinase n=1 Tax=Brachybacterium sp. FME24 TaxID=2742605 RepID=UPI0018674F97|nr:HAMP domain-containing sensor histidine kinase [Brachybacterium sp. FME24]